MDKDRVKVAVHAPVNKISGFMNFVREQGVVGLAVGLAIGAQASELVKIIVGSLITPVLDLMVGPGGLVNLKWTVMVGDRTGIFTVGNLLDAMLRFLAVLLVIYFVVKGFNFDKMDKKKDGQVVATVTTSVKAAKESKDKKSATTKK